MKAATMTSKRAALLVALLCLCGWGVLQWTVGHSRATVLSIEDDFFSLRTAEGVFVSAGQDPRGRASLVAAALVPWHEQRSHVFRAEEAYQKVGTPIQMADLTGVQIVPGLFLLETPDVRLLVMLDDPEDIDSASAVMSHFPLRSDYWVLFSTRIPEGFSPPSEGILFGADHRPGASLRDFAREHHIPLIESANTDGAMITLSPENAPTLRVRSTE